MADCYKNGFGVSKNLETALYWVRLAANQSHTEAMSKLGFYYEQGIGTEKDLETACLWYSKAALNGHVGAKSVLFHRFGLTQYLLSKEKTRKEKQKGKEREIRGICDIDPQAESDNLSEADIDINQKDKVDDHANIDRSSPRRSPYPCSL